jgi:hypothetical protein
MAWIRRGEAAENRWRCIDGRDHAASVESRRGQRASPGTKIEEPATRWRIDRRHYRRTVFGEEGVGADRLCRSNPR